MLSCCHVEVDSGEKFQGVLPDDRKGVPVETENSAESSSGGRAEDTKTQLPKSEQAQVKCCYRYAKFI